MPFLLHLSRNDLHVTHCCNSCYCSDLTDPAYNNTVFFPHVRKQSARGLGNVKLRNQKLYLVACYSCRSSQKLNICFRLMATSCLSARSDGRVGHYRHQVGSTQTSKFQSTAALFKILHCINSFSWIKDGDTYPCGWSVMFWKKS